jgi:hypothetical protein
MVYIRLNPKLTVMSAVDHVIRIISLCSGLLFIICPVIQASHDDRNTLPVGIEIAPVLGNIESTDLTYTVGSGKVKITGTLTVSDDDSKNIRSATIRISSGYNAIEDVLSFTNHNRISGSWNKLTGVLTLTGSSSVANYQTALQSIQYENKNTVNPSKTVRTVSFRVYDGIDNSNSVTRNIVIALPNKAPVLTNIESNPVIYCANSGAVPVTSTLNVGDPDNTDLASAKIQISSGYTQNDILRFTDQNGIAGTWNSVTGTMTLTGTASLSSYQTALRSISYENDGSSDAGNRAVSFSVNDGTTFSNTVSRGIDVSGRVSGILTGTVSVCNDHLTSATLGIYLTGKAPWTFTLLRNNDSVTTYTNISKEPFAFKVNQDGTYRIKSIFDANCKGDTAGSGYARVTYNAIPTAVISGTGYICPGDTAELSVLLTGTAPWTIAYLRNGSNQTVISGVRTADYRLKVTQNGTYSLSSVEDALCKGLVSGTAQVETFVRPTATISGNDSICENTSANLSFVLTGDAPWKFSYKLNNNAPVAVENVLASPKSVPVNDAGTYTLTEVSDAHCTGTFSGSAKITLIPAPHVTISGLAPAYNKEDDQLVPIFGEPAGGTFSGPGLFFSDPDWYFLPRYAPVGILDIVYAYQESALSCVGYDTVQVRVLEADAVIEFPDGRTNFCSNESPFTVSGVNLVGSTGTFTISGGAGLTDNHNNTATIDPSLLGVNEYTITYSYYDGTLLSVHSKFEIRNPPVADFQWETECYMPEQSIHFKNTSTSTFGTITGSEWRIQTATGYDTDTTWDISHIFPQSGNYPIELNIRTSFGCTGSTTRIFGLKPNISLADKVYFEDFESKPINWQSGTSFPASANSWTLGNPTSGFSGALSGDSCWYTQIPGSASPHEQSWVISPCFDFRGIKRPMLKLKIWRLFNSNRDGANLQFTADSGKTWTLLGKIADGINWFNSYNILGFPGGSSVGWSNTDDAGWTEARHSLDMLKGISNVQFRIAYGSDGTAHNNYGIAFDDFWIGQRNRIALLEHFTNASDIRSKAADLAVNAMAEADSLSVVNLQYHTSFPGKDPFNEQEPFAPGARVLYYGLSDVPYSVLNGGTTATHRFEYEINPLNPDTVYVESLLDSKFDMNILSSEDGSVLNIVTQLTAKQDIPASEFTVHIAVVERKITGVIGNNGDSVFRNVVKALLPDPAGTTFYRSWAREDNISIGSSWKLQNVYDPSELRTIAFIQDENTGEVYQSAIDSSILITALHSEIPGEVPGARFVVFPNPASDRIFVRFEEPVTSKVKIELFNNLGSPVYSGNLQEGEFGMEIPTGEFPDGFYMIRVQSSGQAWGIKKLTITR